MQAGAWFKKQRIIRTFRFLNVQKLICMSYSAGRRISLLPFHKAEESFRSASSSVLSNFPIEGAEVKLVERREY